MILKNSLIWKKNPSFTEELLADIDTEVPRGLVDSPEPSGDRTINADSTGDETVINRPAHEAVSEMVRRISHL